MGLCNGCWAVNWPELTEAEKQIIQLWLISSSNEKGPQKPEISVSDENSSGALLSSMTVKEFVKISPEHSFETESESLSHLIKDWTITDKGKWHGKTVKISKEKDEPRTSSTNSTKEDTLTEPQKEKKDSSTDSLEDNPKIQAFRRELEEIALSI
ncbi:hypothetical protein Tco_1337348 [Tanacetum coccineum]